MAAAEGHGATVSFLGHLKRKKKTKHRDHAPPLAQDPLPVPPPPPPDQDDDDDGDDETTWPDTRPSGSTAVDYTFLTQALDAHRDVQHVHLTEATIKAKGFRTLQQLICDERLLLAHTLQHKIEAFLASTTATTDHNPNTAWTRHAMALPSTRCRLQVLQQRVAVIHQAFQLLASHDGWTFAQKLFGVTTHYRLCDDGSLTVRLQGELKGCSVRPM